MLLNGLAAAIAKFASASTVAQVATGVGITVAGVTGAGAAGVLPGAVQDGVASAIETVTPFDLPDSADDVAETQDSRRDDADDAEHGSPTTIPPVPTVPVPAVPTTTAPTTAEATEHTEVEPGDDDGVHQHRGGREVTVPVVPTDNSGPGSVTSGRDHAEDDGASAPSTVDTPEVEDHHEEGDDDGGHHGGDDDPDDDRSGHGGGDDD
jgi:hypothetical protein